MAEPSGPQTSPGASVAAQSGSRLSHQSPSRRAIVSASAAGDACHLRRRENATADPGGRPSGPADASRSADPYRANLSSARGARDPGRPGCADRAHHAPCPPAPPSSRVRRTAAGAPSSVAAGSAHRRGGQSVDSYASGGHGMGPRSGGAGASRLLAAARIVAQSERTLVQSSGTPAPETGQHHGLPPNGSSNHPLWASVGSHCPALSLDLQRLSTPAISGSRIYGTVH